MSIEREGSLTRFNCDGAGCYKNYEGGEFFSAWAEAKSEGWVNLQSRGSWQHYCPTCKKQLGD